jgi:hypothetical protein
MSNIHMRNLKRVQSMTKKPAMLAVAADSSGLSIRKLALYGIFAVLFTAATVQPASANKGSNKIIYSSLLLCVQSDASFSQRIPGAFSSDEAYAATYPVRGYAISGGCTTSSGVLEKPNGHVAVRLDLYWWTGSEWKVCRKTDWKYGGSGYGRTGDITYAYGTEQHYYYGESAPCGPAYYGTMAYSYVWDGSAWRGGSNWSGYEYRS